MLNRSYLTRNIILWIIFIISFSNNTFSDTNPYRIYDINSGLTDIHIHDQIIDNHKYLWIATEKGLNKFDGYNYIYFTVENNKLPNNHINSLAQNEKTIFAASNKFVSAIDIKTNSSSIIIKIEQNEIHKIYYTSNNLIVLFLNTGDLLFYSKQFKLLKKIKLREGNSSKIEENNGHLFISFLGDEIYEVDLKNYAILKKHKIEVNYDVTELKNIKNFGLLFTNRFGMYKYSHTKNEFQLLGSQFKGINCISPYNDSVVCLLYNHYKIKFYNFYKNEFLLTEFSTPNNSYVEEVNIINDNIILGTNQGIIAFKISSKAFEPINIERTVNVGPRAIVESKSGDIYYITNQSILFQKKGTRIPKLIYNQNFNFYSAIEVGDNIYIGTEGLGLKKISKSTHQVSDVVLSEQFKDRRHIISLYQVNNHKLLLGCNPGLYEYDILTGEVLPINIYTSGKDLHRLNYGYNLFDLRYKHITRVNNEIWLSSNQGIVVLSSDLKFKEVINKSSSAHSRNLISDSINYIYQKNKTDIWVATDNGFQKYNYKTKTFSNAIRNSIIRNQTKIIAIIPDNIGRLWISSYFGINLYDPAKNLLTSYHQHDGLVNDEYNFASYCKLNNGNIILGGINGYQLIKPAFIKQTIEKIKINITDIVRLEKDNTFVSVHNNEFIQLNLEDDFIQVRFTANDYTHQESLSYYYRINENSNWISTNKLPVINLSYLPRATEYLYIKVVNDDNLNEQNIIRIPVIIKIKIYKEWWFIPAVLFVFILLISMIVIQTNRVKRIKAKKVEKLKSEELLLQTLSKQKELNSLKTKFIRLVSHEYRTPLTGIATSLDLMDMILANSVQNATIVKEKRHMKNIRLQVDRMSKLIKGVQSLNRMEDFIAKMNLEEGDISAYVKYHIELLVPNNFSLKFHSNSEIIPAKFDKDIMLQILSNIVSNCVKYSFKERKEIIVSCESLYDNTYTIVIQDFGVGIPEKDLPLVFDTFYRSQSIENIQGIGLGLSITKQLIEQMNGTIEIHSIIDYATTISIKFPMNA